MPRKQKKYHYIYKTTCNVNGKYYVGMHSTDDLNDEYLGSGKRLRYSINKHGKENFKVEFLEFFDNRKNLIDREIEIVNEDLVQDPMCMNLMQGGSGGFVSVEAYKKGAQGMNKIIWTDIEFIKRHNKRKSELFKKLHKEEIIKPYDWTGKKHKESTKQKIGKANSVYQKGEGNSQYGTCWITKDCENKKIKKDDLFLYIKQGWIKGRISKKSMK